MVRLLETCLSSIAQIEMALSFGIDDYIEGGVITAVILLNIIVGYALNRL
jgi:Na+-exporting ATPase